MTTLDDNVVPFRSIGLYIEELTLFAAINYGGRLGLYGTPTQDEWWCCIEADEMQMALGSGETMNHAVLDLYHKLRAVASDSERDPG